MATPVPTPCKLVEDSDIPPQTVGNQQTLDLDDVIKFVEPLPDELQCPLCLEFLKEPTLTSCCGHHFCRECINRAITRSHVCPLCNNQGFQTLLNKEKQRLVNTLKVYCKWKSQGCEWVGELGRLEHHLDVEEGDCGCVEVECEFGPVGCVAKLPRKDLQRHKEENVHKHLVLMSVMSLKSNEAFVKELREQRGEFQQQLKQKDEEITAIQESLLEKNEQLKDLQSQLQQKGQQMATIQDQLELKVNMKLGDLERNQNQEITDLRGRLGQVETSLGDSQVQVKDVKEMIQELDHRTAEEIRGRIQQVETSLQESVHLMQQVNEKVQKLEKQTFIPPLDFTLRDFEKHKKDGDIWYSPPFCSHTGGYKLCLRVHANGKGNGEGTHVSLYVILMCGDRDDHLKWPFRGAVTVQLLNQRREEGHFEETFSFDDRSTDETSGRVIGRELALTGWGKTKLIAHSSLGGNSDKIYFNCLKFRVTNINLTKF